MRPGCASRVVSLASAQAAPTDDSDAEHGDQPPSLMKAGFRFLSGCCLDSNLDSREVR